MTEYVGRVFCHSSEEMSEIPDGVVQTCVTSPPYYGLRDYGTARWTGGDPECDHAVVPDAGATSQREGRTYQQGHPHRDCRCGAVRADEQLGLERSVDDYVARLVTVFREVRRVLRDDGTAWLNLGDSYATGAGSVGNAPGGGVQGESWRGPMTQPNRMPQRGLKPKDLIGVPWRVAFALQADGWFLRSAIVWAKPNPMPSSVEDRPTSSYEMVFLLAKNERYFYDADSIRDPYTAGTQLRAFDQVGRLDGQAGSERANGGMKTNGPMKAVVHARDERHILEFMDESERPQTRRAAEIARAAGLTDAHFSAIRAFGIADAGKAAVTQSVRNTGETMRLATEAKEALGGYFREFVIAARALENGGANKRDVWTIPTKPYADAHFATFPIELPSLCIRAGTSEVGACVVCGAPWRRRIDLVGGQTSGRTPANIEMARSVGRINSDGSPNATGYGSSIKQEYLATRVTRGFEPTCDHKDTPTRPCIVLDPFMGSGTTAEAAEVLGRSWTGFELNPDYHDLIAERTRQRGLFAQ